MPHVKARDYGSLGFGYAYAYAEDQGCRFADIIATVNAQRSRHFGPDASYGDLGGQTNDWPRTSSTRASRTRASSSGWSGGASRAARQGRAATVRGFAAGWNAYLRRLRRQPAEPGGRGAAWVKPIRRIDLYRRIYQLGLRASGGALLEGMVNAAPPGTAAAAAASEDKPLDDSGGMGSNGYAIGADGARDATRCCTPTLTSHPGPTGAGTSCTSRSRARSTRSAPRCKVSRSSTSASTATSRGRTRSRPRAASPRTS